MYHALDNDAPDWACLACGQHWADAAEFIGDPGDCAPAWVDRTRADEVAPIIWAGTEADEYAHHAAPFTWTLAGGVR